MPDPMMRPHGSEKDSPLFPDRCVVAPLREPSSPDWTQTSNIAGQAAARASAARYARILQLLQQHGPLSLWEIAGLMNVDSHQISGRITELKRDGHIEPTGETRNNPATDCPAAVYRLRPPITAEDAKSAEESR